MGKIISTNEDTFKTDLEQAKFIHTTREKRLILTLGEFYIFKIKTRVRFCKNCNQEIEYNIDGEVALRIEDEKMKPKPTLISKMD